MSGPVVQVLLDDGTGSWPYEITQYVDLGTGISITRGRQDEFSDVQPSTCSLTLDNVDGRFTPGAVKKNLMPNPSFESGTTGWTGTNNCTVSTTTSVAAVGTAALKMTATSAGTGMSTSSVVGTGGIPVTAGQTYTVQAKFLAATTGEQTCYVSILWYGTSSGGLMAQSNGSKVTDTTAGWTQATCTGTAPTGAGFAAVQVTVDVFGSQPAVGEVHYVDAVQFEQGSTATAYADPPFPATVDQPIRVNVTTGGTTYTRFTGYVNAWPVAWPGGNLSEVQITASDRMARLARRQFRSVVEQSVRALNPHAYYTLGEPTGAKTAGDTSGYGQPSLSIASRGTGGTVDFGAGTGPGTDSLPAVVFSPSDSSNGKYLTTTFPSAPVDWSVGHALRVVANTSTVAARALAAVEFTNGSGFEIGTDATGHPQVRYTSGHGGGTPYFTFAGTASIADGATHDLVLVFTPNASGYPYWDLTLDVDGTSVATLNNQQFGAPIAKLHVGGQPAGAFLATATISHVALFPTALTSTQISTLSAAVSGGFGSDSSDARIARYAGWANITSADLALEAGVVTSLPTQDTTGMSVLDAMKTIEQAEGGLLFVDGHGRLAFHARNHRYGAASKVTFQADDVGSDTQFLLDTQGLVNSVTASRPGGANQTVENSDSITAHEQYPQSLTLLLNSDDEVIQAANWMVNLHSNPAVRVSNTTVDLLTQPSTFVTSMLALNFGDRITLSGMPSQAPAAPDLFIEGWAEKIGTSEWSMNLNTSLGATVWIIEDPVYGAVETTNRIAY